MKKLTALFTIVAMLVCMFTFAPTAGAAEMYGPDGETVNSSERFPNKSTVTVHFMLKCNNGWLDGTNGSDYVEASMWSTETLAVCTVYISLEATYIQDGSYTTDSDYESASSLSSMSLSIYPSTDLLSSGYASFSVGHATYGSVSDSLSASCPTAVK
jgi:hypothetical protein